MKKPITLLILLAFYLFSHGQTLTVSVPTVTANIGDAVYIPVKLTGASSTGVPISSANIQITYDTAVLHYDDLTNFYTSTPQSQWFYSGHDGLVSANWLEPSLGTLAIPDGTTMYEIKFTKKAGNSPLTFVVYEFTDNVYNLVPTTPLHGAVNAPAIYRQVTFKVDMSKENITSSGVHLAGSFNGWSATQTPMTLGSNSIYTTTVSLLENQNYTYKFVNGNTTAGFESVPASCGVINTGGQYERSITIPVDDTTLNPVCFSMCTACPVSVNVTFRVNMQNETVSPNGVHVAGTFNGWNYGQTFMNPTGGTVYETSMIMDEGNYHEFRFVNGITAGDSEILPGACSVNGNRSFTVPSHDTTLVAYCFDSCVACGTVASYTNITFRVDMRRMDSLSVFGVHLAGSFQGWLPGATPMLSSGDSVFTYTDSILTGSIMQYKFVNGNTAAGYEIVPVACAVNGNREFTVPVNDTVLKLVCYSSCNICGPGTGTTEPNVSAQTMLFQNAPNPCKDHTRIGFYLQSPGLVTISLFDFTGRKLMEVTEGRYEAGRHNVEVNVSALKPGVYYYRMNLTGHQGGTETMKMVVTK